MTRISQFLMGFEKAASTSSGEDDRKSRITPGGAALAAGGVTGAGVFGTDVARNVMHERKISKLPNMTHKELIKNLRPGDILTFRDREAEIAGAPKILHGEKFLMGMGTGSPYSHAAVHIEGGKILQAKGLGRKSKEEHLRDYVLPKEEIRVFRHKDQRVSGDAAKRSKNLTGIPYSEGTKDVTDYGKHQLLGGGEAPADIPTKKLDRKAKKKCNPKSGVCYPLAADAYGKKTFKKRNIGYQDLAHHPDFEVVGRSSGSMKYKPQSLARADALGAYVARPAIKALKWGLPIAGATYLGAKAMQLMGKKEP